MLLYVHSAVQTKSNLIAAFINLLNLKAFSNSASASRDRQGVNNINTLITAHLLSSLFPVIDQNNFYFA